MMKNANRRRIGFSAAFLFFAVLVMIISFPQDSFWYDETTSAYLTLESWDTLWEWTTELDIQPPLYFASLKLWSDLAGHSEFALRLYSSFAGLLAVAGMLRLGRQVNHNGGWVAASVLLFSGGFLYAYGEVRTYSLVLAAGIWSCVFLLMSLKQARYIPIYGVITLIALYSHYTALFLVAAQGIYVLIQRDWRKLLIFVLPAVGFAPWMLVIVTTGLPEGLAFEGQVTLENILRTYWDFFLYGQHIVDAEARLLATLIVLPFLLVIVGWLLWQRRQHLGLVVSVVPILLLIAGIILVESKLSGRHGWALWIGISLLMGSVRLPRAIVGMFLVAYIVGIGFWRDSIEDQYPSHLDAAFAYMERHAGENDLLLLRDGTLFTAAEYYDAPITYIGLPDAPLTNVNHQLHFNEGVPLVASQFDSEAENIWVLSWQGYIMDPQELAYAFAEYIGGTPMESLNFGDVHLARYAAQGSFDIVRHIGELPGLIQVPPDGPSLLGVDVYNGCEVIIHAWWWRGESDDDNARISYRLTDGEGEIYISQDAYLSAQNYPQRNWLPFTPTLGRVALRWPQHIAVVDVHLMVYDAQGEKPEQPIYVDTLERAATECRPSDR